MKRETSGEEKQHFDRNKEVMSEKLESTINTSSE